MRVLMCTTANDAHLGPLLPFAKAWSRSGHEVRVAAPASYGTSLARVELPHEPFPDASPGLIGPVMAGPSALAPEEAEEVVLREVFGRFDAQAALRWTRSPVSTRGS